MGLSVALSNALSGMRTGQSSLDVLSRNIANAGTPGYHRQSLSLVDGYTSSANVRTGAVSRAFSASLQAHYTREIADASYATTRAGVLDRMQAAFGKPGDTGSLDTVYNDFRAALSTLSASPDDFSARGSALSSAQALAGTLNRLSTEVQSMRVEAESELANGVAELNSLLESLETINGRFSDPNVDQTARASLADERDRVVSGIAELIDIRVDYRSNGSATVMTRSGVGLVDHEAASFDFQSGGLLSAGSTYSIDPSKNGVGTLTMRSSGGLVVDAVGQRILGSGRLAALVELRDNSLVAAQSQLDDIAAGLAQALSTVETTGTATTSGAAGGFDLDLAAIRPGNDFVLTYRQNGVEQNLRIVRVDEPSQLPMDYVDGDGNRVVGLSFAGGAAGVASALAPILGSGFAVANPGGSLLQIHDDGAGATTDVVSLTARTTIAANRDAGLGLSLFVDSNGGDFTNAIGVVRQKVGFAGRIEINPAVLTDNRLLVQYETGGAMGDAARIEYLGNQLGSLRFSSGPEAVQLGARLTGSVGDLVSQTLNFQGNRAADALGQKQARGTALDVLGQRLESEFGVNVDEEMARLMELQNAFAANARVVAAVQDLINTLFEI